MSILCNSMMMGAIASLTGWAGWNGSKDGAASSTSQAGYTPAVCQLTSTTCLVFYGDPVNSYGWAAVGTLTGDTIVWSTAVNVTGTTTVSTYSIVALSSTQVIAAFVGGPHTLKSVIINISGTVPSGATIKQVSSGTNYSYLNIGGLDKTSSTQAIVAYDDEIAGIGYVVALSVASSVITVGTPLAFAGAYPTYTQSVSNISSSAALVFYEDGNNSNHPTAQIISISGTTLTTNTPYVVDSSINSGSSNDTSLIAQLSATSFVVGYNNYPTTLYTAALSVSGTTITVGSRVTIESVIGTNYNNGLCNADSTSVMAVYIGTSNHIYGRVCSVSGTTITLSTAVDISGSAFSNPSIANMDISHNILVFSNNSSATVSGQVISIA